MNGFMLNHKTIQQIIFQGAYLQKSCLKGILWFEEPSWLKSDVSKWPVNLKDSGDLKTIPEERVHMHFAVNVFDLDLFSKFSSLTKLKRVVALCKRFIFNLQHPNEKLVAAITTNKLDQSLLTLVKIFQQQSFQKELSDLMKSKRLK